MPAKIKCCKDCVPPKRYPGCGANCKEYKEEKAQYEIDKQKAIEHLRQSQDLTSFDFDKICYAGCKRVKFGKKRRH